MEPSAGGQKTQTAQDQLRPLSEGLWRENFLVPGSPDPVIEECLKIASLTLADLGPNPAID
jgi:hypothetical protein